MSKSDRTFKFPTQTKPEFAEASKICTLCWWSKESRYGSNLECKRREISKVDMVKGKLELSVEKNASADSERHGYIISESQLKYESPSTLEQKETANKEKCGIEGKYFLNKEDTQVAFEMFPDRFMEEVVPVPMELLEFIPLNEEDE